MVDIKTKNNKIKIDDYVRINQEMIRGGERGKVIELQDNGDIAIVKFKKKIDGNNKGSYFIDDIKKIK
jgi:hypothetical protein